MKLSYLSLALASSLFVFGCSSGAPQEASTEATVQGLTSIRHDETTIVARDGLRLYAQSWSPNGPAKAAIVIMHGLKDHSGRYAGVATELAVRGYAVHAFDLRGHGKSEGQRVWVFPFEQYVDDLEDFVHGVARAHARDPIFLFGHSMGGAIAAEVAAERVPELDGVVLSGAALSIGGGVPPMLQPVLDYATRLGFAGAAAEIFGSLPGSLGHKIASAPVFALKNEDFSRDPAVVADMSRDPLIYQKPGPAITAFGLLDEMGRLQNRAGDLSMPTLLLHGTADKLTNPAGSRYYYDHIGSADKTLKLYDGLYHDLLHEPEKDQVKADVFAWFEAHLSTR